MPNSYNYEKFLKKEPEKVFECISNFSEYQKFLPGCTRSETISTSNEYDIGRLEFNFFGKSYSIKSKNMKYPNKLLIDQIEGPFYSLSATWQVFEKNGGSQIKFYVEFNAPIILKPFLNQTLIDSFSDKLMDAFLRRIS